MTDKVTSEDFDPTAMLRDAGLRRTPVRVAVIESLRAADRPGSVQDLLTRLPDGTDAVTVYRTLKTLVDHKLARRVRGEDRGWLFEAVSNDPATTHAHPHFVCDSCGTVECLSDVSMRPPRVPMSAKLAEGYEVTKQEVTLHGVCPKCH